MWGTKNEYLIGSKWFKYHNFERIVQIQGDLIIPFSTNMHNDNDNKQLITAATVGKVDQLLQLF